MTTMLFYTWASAEMSNVGFKHQGFQFHEIILADKTLKSGIYFDKIGF